MLPRKRVFNEVIIRCKNNLARGEDAVKHKTTRLKYFSVDTELEMRIIVEGHKELAGGVSMIYEILKTLIHFLALLICSIPLVRM